MNDHPDLFPETAQTAAPIATSWTGQLADQWGHPRVALRLLSQWQEKTGLWHCGWFVQLDRAVDEWHPAHPHKHAAAASYPWYRLSELPCSRRFGIAAANAARAARIVLEQMQAYAEDAAGAQDARDLSDRVEAQARQWLLS